VRRKASAPRDRPRGEQKWDFRLYVAGQTARSIAAVQNLNRICEEYAAVGCKIRVIDVMKCPQVAAGEQIVALPTLVLRVPGGPSRRVIGDLSNTEKVLTGLRLRP